jgi:glucose/arabinose dehydrogenase
LSSSGTGGAQTIDLLDSAPREYELRVRYRDETGAVSGYETRLFNVAPASTIFPMEFQDVVDFPAPTWIRSSGGAVTFPAASPNPSQMRLESAEGELLWSRIDSTVVNPPSLAHHAQLRVVIVAGSNGLVLEASKFSFQDDGGLNRTLFLPALNLIANQRLDLWVAVDGSTYYGTAAQTEPVFTNLARSSDLPFVALQPGYEIEVVATGMRLPVNIAFVPDPGPDPDDPLYYVAELYGSIQVVRRDGTRQTFATSLLDYNPEGPFGGTGEQGLTGLAVQRDTINPDVYHLYVGMLWDNGAPPGPDFHYPKVERLTSTAGGLSMASRTLLRNMQPETQGQSHQISNISIGPDNKLYVHMGDGFNFTTAQNLNQYRGKVLRMNLDGSAPTDNPFYSAADGISARDFVFAYGLRNPFGGAWRAADGKHYQVENGPSVDRLSQINRGVNYGWNNTDASMTINAIYNWTSAHAPVNLDFIQPQTFQGSQFPAGKMDHLFVSESGPTYAAGPQTRGKRISEFVIDLNGALVTGPTTLVQYSGTGRGSVVALAAGPDGLYFSEFYEDSGANGPTAAGARIFRVRYVIPLAGDYNIDGGVDQADYSVWKKNFGSNLFLAADGNGNGIVDTADYVVWRNNLNGHSHQGAAAVLAVSETVESPAEVAGDNESVRPSVPLYVPAQSHRQPAKTLKYRSEISSPRDQALLTLLESFQDRGRRQAEASSKLPEIKSVDDGLPEKDGQLPRQAIDGLFDSWCHAF